MFHKGATPVCCNAACINSGKLFNLRICVQWDHVAGSVSVKFKHVVQHFICGSLRRLLSLWREPLIKYLAAIVILPGLRLYLCNEVGSVY